MEIPSPPRALVSSQENFDTSIALSQELSSALNALGVSAQSSPWRLAGPLEVSAGSFAHISQTLNDLNRDLNALGPQVIRDIVNQSATASQLIAFANWLDYVSIGFGRQIAEAKQIINPQWLNTAQTIRHAIHQFTHANRPRIQHYKPTVISLDLETLYAKSLIADKKIFGKKKLRLAILAGLEGHKKSEDEPIHPKHLTPALLQWIQIKRQLKELKDFINTQQGFILPYNWNPLVEEESDHFEKSIVSLELTHALAVNYSQHEHLEESFNRILELSNVENSNAIRTFHVSWTRFLSALNANHDEVESWLNGRGIGEAISQSLTRWEADSTNNSFLQLQRWVRIQLCLRQYLELGYTQIPSLVTQETLNGNNSEFSIRRALFQEVLKERLESTGLGGFDERNRASLTERFLHSGNTVRKQLSSELPARIIGSRKFDPNQRVGMVADLRQQLGRRRGGLTVRQLIHRFGGLITEISPCFLMSPSSVARFLPTDSIDFDVVVFDEASQIRVPEAIGAIGRSKSVIIVGDSQQMPPTSAFMSAMNTEDDDVITTDDSLPVPTDMESILSEAVESRIPRLLLSWHYRSRDESLIAFSNHAYYDGRLSSFPTPPLSSAEKAISLKNVNGVWEGGRGGARVNRVEADAIVKAIRSLLKENPEKSIGVVTFNTQQRDLILDKLDELRETDRALEAAFTRNEESLFVKNLENVQGDERDIIFFTLAFAKGENGRVPLNWGPLSRSGGEKRFNVAVTRAKEKVIVIASFEPHELDLSNSHSVGLARLKEYLQAAKHGMEQASFVREPFFDQHLLEVGNYLKEAGLEVRTKLGLSDFTVDLAVRSGNNPWVAILLDGPGWAERQSVGDREALPQSVLVDSMGWSRVERIWLPTWIRNHEAVVAEIVESAQNSGISLEQETDILPLTSEEPEPVVESMDGFATKTAQPGTKAKPFRPAHDRIVGNSYTIESGFSSGKKLVSEQLNDIIEAESPILMDRLLKVLATRFNINRLHSTRKSSLQSYVPRAQQEIAPNGDCIVWSLTNPEKKFKGYRVPEFPQQRDIADVPYPELLNAMLAITEKSHAISEDDLLRETAREFGVTRLASRVRPRLEGVLGSALKTGLLEYQNGLLHIR